MSWVIDQIIATLGKTKLINLVCKIFRKVFGKLYRDMLAEVQAAELVRPPLSGYEKAKMAIAGFKERHNEAAEWAWLVNVLLEIAVGEYKRYGERV